MKYDQWALFHVVTDPDRAARLEKNLLNTGYRAKIVRSRDGKFEIYATLSEIGVTPRNWQGQAI